MTLLAQRINDPFNVEKIAKRNPLLLALCGIYSVSTKKTAP